MKNHHFRDPKQPEAGDFPFPVLAGEEESKYLTWVRNHSSYLNLSGVINVLQALAVYVRGVLGNLLIISPVLILLGTVLGMLHFTMVANPFWLTKWMTFAALICAIGFFAIRSANSEFRPPGRLAGCLFLALLTCAIVEMSPLVIEYFRKSEYFDVFGFKESSSIILSVATGAGIVIRYLPESGALRRGFMLAVLALFGFGLTWLVLLLIANYICYGLPPHGWSILIPFFTLCAFGVCAVLYVLNSPELGRLFKAIAVAGILLGLIVLGVFRSSVFTEQVVTWSEGAGDYIGTITRPLRRVVDGANHDSSTDETFDSSPNANQFGENVTSKDSELSLYESDLKNKLVSLKANIRSLDHQGNVVSATSYGDNHLAYRLGLASFDGRVDFDPAYFENAAIFLEQAEGFGELPAVDRNILLNKLSSEAKYRLWKLTVSPKPSQQLAGYGNSVNYAKVNRGGSSEEAMKQWLDDQSKTQHQFMELVAIRACQKEVEKRLRRDSLYVDFKLSPEDLAGNMDAIFPLEELTKFQNQLRVPLSQAESYLRLTGRLEEFETYRGKTAPDAALSGPLVIKPIVQPAEGPKEGGEKGPMECTREFIFVSAVLNVIPPDEGVDYLNSVYGTLESVPETVKADATREDYLNLIRMRDTAVEKLILVAMSGHLVEDSKDVEAMLEVDFKDTNLRGSEKKDWAIVARQSLANLAISPPIKSAAKRDREKAVFALGELFDPQVPQLQQVVGETEEGRMIKQEALYRQPAGEIFEKIEIRDLLARSFVFEERENSEYLLRRMVFGRYGNLEKLDSMSQDLYQHALPPKLLLVGPIFVLLIVVNLVFIDANSTSIHAFYRDRLAHAFLMKPSSRNVEGGVVNTVEADMSVKLSELCNYETGKSTAPYHLINAALNMNHSGEDKIRNRNADFFVFSKLFVGGKYTGYMRTKEFEKLAPELTAASAMAISGAAVSANMGKYSNGIITFFLSILNLRLGYWVPNPVVKGQKVTFHSIFEEELKQIALRRAACRDNSSQNEESEEQAGREVRKIAKSSLPTVEHDFLGMSLSGGGIRSAALNLGVLQVLSSSRLLPEIDFLSTVSGGGYTGTAVSTFMRERESSTSVTTVSPSDSASAGTKRSKMARAIQKAEHRFSWMPKSRLLYNEMCSRVNHRLKWVNVSDGGHIENLGVYELLRRRCRIIIAGDGEADPNGVFDGLSSLMRLAEIDLGIRIEFADGALDFAKPKAVDDVDPSVGEASDQDDCKPHFGVGTISYPQSTDDSGAGPEKGYIIYLKSCFQGNEDQIVKNYKQMHPSFPHETTADQLFDEGQFEAYRRLGFGIAQEALQHLFEGEQPEGYSHLLSKLRKFDQIKP